MEGGIGWASGLDKMLDHLGRWERAGATHLSVNTMNAGLQSVDDHLDALARAADALGLNGGDGERPDT
jgi:hypothetical protein